jgi:hypothetical protein
VTSEMLLPAKAEVARHLERYRAWERLMLASPTDRTVRGNFEDTGYTLCVLMGKRCAREAAHAAERYLCADLTPYRWDRGNKPDRRDDLHSRTWLRELTVAPVS